MLLSLLLAACVIVAGFALTYWIPVRLRVEERVAIGAVVAAGVLLGVFLFGRSRGRRRTTIVEVRRF